MEAKEARIGNWVLIPTNDVIKVPCYPKQIKGITRYGEFDFTEPDYPEPHIVHAKHCAEIELTEELLLECGFSIDHRLSNEREKDRVYHMNPVFFGKSDKTDVVGSDLSLIAHGDKIFLLKNVCMDNSYLEDGIRIKSLHHLQNIHYDTAGEELTFDIEKL